MHESTSMIYMGMCGRSKQVLVGYTLRVDVELQDSYLYWYEGWIADIVSLWVSSIHWYFLYENNWRW
jgi:hypothetical protein